MSNLEDELARFEAELAAVETSNQQETSHQQETNHQHDYGAPISHYSSSAAQVSAPANAPPAPAVPAPQPAQHHPQQPQHHPTGPMYHEYNPPAQAAAPPMMGEWAAYGVQQQAYGAQAGAYYMQPGMEGYMSAPAPTMTGATLSAAPVFTAPDEMEPAQDDGSIPKEEGFKGKDYKKPGEKVKRFAAGQTWWDPTLAEWPENDFRIFVGDLGNEVNDDVLGKAFQKYPSYAKAKVVRDKRSNKSKGFGFVSFLESGDYAKALREMDGKYIGNRPCKLRKSSWQERNANARGKHNKKQKTG